MDRIVPSELKSVLIVRIGKIGDIIATSFVFEIIKKNNPEAKVCLITKSSNKNVLKHNPSIDEIFYVDSGIKLYFQLLKLKKKYFDLIIDFNDNPSKTTRIIFSLFRAGTKCGYDFPLYSEYLDIKVPQPDKKNSHIIERMAHFLESIGFKCDRSLIKPFIYTGQEEEKEIALCIKKFEGKKIIALNISAGAEIRFWDVKNWISFVSRISELNKDYVFLLLSMKENENEALEIMNAVDNERIIKPGLPSFQHFAAAIKASFMLISPDTSAVHVASAAKIPVLALYPKSDWNFASWRPYGTNYRAIHSNTENINSILVDQVFFNFVELNKEITENGPKSI